MTFVSTADCARAAIRYNLFGKDVINTLWVKNTTGSTDSSAYCSGIAGALATWATDTIMPYVTEDMSLREVTVTSQESVTATSVTLPVIAVDGGITNPGLPSTNCITLKFNTAERGRSGRGRNYLSGLYESGVVENTVVNTFLDHMLDAYLALFDVLDAWDSRHVVVSFVNDGVARANGYAQEVLSYQFSDAYVDTQRKRGATRGS